MSIEKKKPAKNAGDSLMTIGVLMILASILLPLFGVAMTESTNLGLLLGGLGVAVVGWALRNSLRRKAGS